MIRTELFKYIYIPDMIEERVKELTDLGLKVEQKELYYLPDDPWENNNLVEEKRDVVADYQQLVDNFIIAGKRKATATGNVFQLDEEMIQKLRGLGYIK